MLHHLLKMLFGEGERAMVLECMDNTLQSQLCSPQQSFDLPKPQFSNLRWRLVTLFTPSILGALQETGYMKAL